MSGGVDSSVSAALLKKQGFDVFGIFLRLWKTDGENNKSLEDAKKVAKILNIELRAVDVRKKFKKEVVGYFLKEYASGRTPNPCVFCNENLKFKILFQEADKIKADYVSTGHYARIEKQEERSKKGENKKNINENFSYRLFEAEDKNKDQSYFLYRLKQNQLARIIFPLGEYKKEEVRKLAKKFDLPNFDKAESQDICFLGNTSVEDFLKKNLRLKAGNIFDFKNKIIGRHFGLPLYTIGQRKGIKIGGTGPYYVSNKDFAKNKLVVTNTKKDSALFSKSATLEKVNWIDNEPKMPTKLLVRARYRNPLSYATISKKKELRSKNKEEYRIVFEKSQRAVTPGQSIVFYNKKQEVLGGGVIK